VGSSLPPFRIACFDKYKNKIPFTSVPSLEVELEASPGFLIKIDKLETNLINDGLILKIEVCCYFHGISTDVMIIFKLMSSEDRY